MRRVISVLCTLFALAAATAENAKVLHVFYSYDCEHCSRILNDTAWRQRISDTGFTPEYYEISVSENFDALLLCEKSIGRKGEDFPEFIAGNRLFWGEEGNTEEFFAFLAGTTEKDNEAISGIIARATVFNEPVWDKSKIDDKVKALKDLKRVHAAYFYSEGCKECSKAHKMIAILKKRYGFTLDEYRLPDHAGLLEMLEERFNVPEEKRASFPKLVIGDNILMPDEMDKERIEELLGKYKSAPPFWRELDNSEEGKQKIIERFRHFNVFAIVAAGLIDGINPCAFTTILFFISFLTLIKRTKREILMTGIAFCAAIFIAYFAIGVGLVFVFNKLGVFTLISKIIYIAMAAVVFIFAGLSFFDYIKFKQGRSREAVLQLPDYLKKMAHSIIRRGREAKNIWVSAFITGILISFVEFACTGQVYLPTITFVMKVPEFRLKAMMYLLLYNLFFIIPLIIVFILAYFGLSSEKLNAFYQKAGAGVKLATAIFFLLLGILLVVLTL